MGMTEAVKGLLNEYSFTKAFVLDDAYDKAPDFSQLGGLVGADLPEELEKVDEALRIQLNEILAAEGLEADDWDNGITLEPLLRKLWELRKAGQLPEAIGKEAFSIYDREVEQKKSALEPLLNFLSTDLQLTVNKAGRESKKLPSDSKIVFLDLFLGITDDAAARDEAADKIKELLAELGDRERPIVVLMSSKTGEELESMAEHLRRRAGLLGAKFRVLSKHEFDREDAIGSVLHDLLAPLPSANTLGELIDTWDETLKSLRDTIKSDLRMLDLSDYAFLAKYRLEVENMPLGSYLLEAYSDVVRYRLEGCDDLRSATRKVDALDFTSALPPAHFLPQPGVNLLSHAVNFVNEDLIRGEGLQMENAAAKLQLGDLIVPGADFDRLVTGMVPEIPIQAVISQVCDLQHGNTDNVFLLEGRLAPRNWSQSIKAQDTRVDCFLWDGREYSINWQEAKLQTWAKRFANTKLSPSGTHRRIARLRPLAALKAQQLFAARLTRIGTLASPHGVIPVNLRVDYKNAGKERVTLFETTSSDKAAVLVNGAVLEAKTEKSKSKAEYAQYLVFSKNFPRMLAQQLLPVVEQMNASVQADVRDFAESDLALAPLRVPCKLGKAIAHKNIKIDLRPHDGQLDNVIGIFANIPQIAAKLNA
jgi:hypothetical protein